jgi:hypothetical protein
LPSTTALPLPPPAANASASVLRAVLWGNAKVLWGNAKVLWGNAKVLWGNAKVLWGNASASVLRAVLCAMVLWGNAMRADSQDSPIFLRHQGGAACHVHARPLFALPPAYPRATPLNPGGADSRTDHFRSRRGSYRASS